jgi:gamma-glutamylputrescine oxidase
MLQFDKLSFWERRNYLDSIDFLIIGSGIVGIAFALQLKNKFKTSKIVILERGYIPTGASTKNAGFACFGSPTEIFDDIEKSNENLVWNTVKMRYEGLMKLLEITGVENINYEKCNSWELIKNSEPDFCKEKLSWLNNKIEKLIDHKNVYSFDNMSIKSNGLFGFKQAIKNRLEGSISTDLLMNRLLNLTSLENITILNGVHVLNYENTGSKVEIQTNYGRIDSNKLIICTNGFANDLVPNKDVNPSRAQVLITKPIENLPLRGTFHAEKGYYYFRNIENRILLGGARCKDFDGETTTKFDNTEIIKTELKSYLSSHFKNSDKFEIDYFWSGIMGTGKEKQPIVEQINKNVYCGVKMGGMGIAIGAEIGSQLLKLITNE